MKVALIFKSFFEFGQWWFKGREKEAKSIRSYSSSYKKQAVKEVDWKLSKDEIEREMRSNRCIGGHYTEEV